MHPVPEFIDPVFVKTRSKCSFSVMENERFGLVFTKTGSINSGTGLIRWNNLMIQTWHMHTKKLSVANVLFLLKSANSKEKNRWL